MAGSLLVLLPQEVVSTLGKFACSIVVVMSIFSSDRLDNTKAPGGSKHAAALLLVLLLLPVAISATVVVVPVVETSPEL